MKSLSWCNWQYLSFQHGPILVEDTQESNISILTTNGNGNIVDDEGNVVDLTKYGINLGTVAETQLTDVVNDTQDDGNGFPDLQLSSWAAPISSTVRPTFSSGTVSRNVAVMSESSSDARDSSSTSNNDRKRRLMPKEAQSDFIEDHLLRSLDAGKTEKHLQ